VEHWGKDAQFPIRYLWQEHQGKHVAFNHAVREARGELFLTLDSDDACLPNALERLKHHWDSIPEPDRANFSAVTALCLDQTGKLVGTHFPFDPTDSDSLEIRYRFKVKGEKWGFQRTAVLRQFPFPLLEGERYMPERLVWTAIARQYKTRYVNEALRIYYIGERSDQITARSTRLKHARALALAHQVALNDQLDWFPTAPLAFVRSAIQYIRLSLHTRCRLARAVRQLHTVGARLLVILALPVGLASYLWDRMTNRA
jgi:hypothetical protein